MAGGPELGGWWEMRGSPEKTVGGGPWPHKPLAQGLLPASWQEEELGG